MAIPNVNRKIVIDGITGTKPVAKYIKIACSEMNPNSSTKYAVFPVASSTGNGTYTVVGSDAGFDSNQQFTITLLDEDQNEIASKTVTYGNTYMLSEASLVITKG